MKLPDTVMACLQRLEQAGFATFAVGGCVRDWLLGLEPHDHDLCTAATPAEMKAIFADRGLVLAGEKHGTVGIITEGGVVEITTFRTESGYKDNRHPDQVRFVTAIEEDLARRDFTVNAMAWSPIHGLKDPFGGENDLKNRILRAVGDPATRFREDSLRILRGVRFAVKYGLAPEKDTLAAMISLAPLMDNLARERVFDELCKLLPLVNAADLLQFEPILTQVLPELKPCVGFDQQSCHHIHDIYTHTAHTVAGVPGDLTLRWAALLHDTGKPETFTVDETGQGHFYGHNTPGAAHADAALRRLKAPTQLREAVVFLVEQHMTQITPDRKLLRRRLSRWGEQRLRALMILEQADRNATGTVDGPRDYGPVNAIIDEILAENACLGLKDLAVNGNDLMALGYRGKEIGETLEKLLALVLDEQLPNEKEALLAQLRP